MKRIFFWLAEGAVIVAWFCMLMILPVVLAFWKPDKLESELGAQGVARRGERRTFCDWCGQLIRSEVILEWSPGRVEVQRSLMPCLECCEKWRKRPDVLRF